MKKTEEIKNTEGIKRKELVKKIENSQTVQKGKKGISSVIFGRTFLVFFSLFLQLIFMVWGYYWLASKWYFVNGVVTVLGVLEVIYSLIFLYWHAIMKVNSSRMIQRSKLLNLMARA